MLANVGNGFLAAMQAFVKVLPALLRDMAGIGSVAAIAYGAYMLHPAAGWIVGGTLVLIGVLLSSAAPQPKAQS